MRLLCIELGGEYMKIAVVTGASSGIGWEFVKGLDKNEALDEIWVIARRRERLNELAGQTKTSVRVIPMDLTEEESFEAYRRLLEEIRPEIHVLVNNSGFGVFGAFAERPLEQQLKIIDLNDKALVAMTYLSLPYMKKGDMIYLVSVSKVVTSQAGGEAITIDTAYYGLNGKPVGKDEHWVEIQNGETLTWSNLELGVEYTLTSEPSSVLKA